ncbi:MAG: thymidine kinase [Patescibacteria group bacterium]
MIEIIVISGGMFCGKTEDLIGRLRRARAADKRMLVLKQKEDTRTGEEIVARAKDLTNNFKPVDEFPAFPIGSREELESLFKKFNPEVLAIDEGQFFKKWLFEFVTDLRENRREILILVAGLDMDAWGKPFEIMSLFMGIATYVDKKKAICFRCKKEEAIMTQKKTAGSGQRIEIGDAEIYEARCLKCWTPPPEENNENHYPYELKKLELKAPFDKLRGLFILNKIFFS